MNASDGITATWSVVNDQVTQALGDMSCPGDTIQDAGAHAAFTFVPWWGHFPWITCVIIVYVVVGFVFSWALVRDLAQQRDAPVSNGELLFLLVIWPVFLFTILAVVFAQWCRAKTIHAALTPPDMRPPRVREVGQEPPVAVPLHEPPFREPVVDEHEVGPSTPIPVRIDACGVWRRVGE